MDESRVLQHAGWAGAASVVLLVVGVALCSLAGVDAPGVSDAAILERLDDGAKQTAAGIGLPVLAAGTGLLLWFAGGLRRVLDRLSGGDPLAHATVPAAALLGGLIITGASIDVSSAVTAWSDEFTPDPDTARVLGTAGAVVALTGLTGGATMVAVTTRIAQQARALPTWAVWVSYAVAVLCLSGFWSGAWRPWPSRCGSSAPSPGCCARRGGHRRSEPSRRRAHHLRRRPAHPRPPATADAPAPVVHGPALVPPGGVMAVPSAR